MNYLGSKTIETDRLILRKTQEEDLKTLWEILLLPEVNKYYLTCKINSDWELEKKWQYKKLENAKNPDTFQWTIVLKDTNEVIGQISCQEKGEDKSIRDAGWFIAPTHHRKGYAYEAASAMIEYMFKEVDITAIETSAAVTNPSSWRLMEKLKFKKRGEDTYICNYTFAKDQECYSYGLTKDEYLAN